MVKAAQPREDPVRRRANELMERHLDGDRTAFDELCPILITWLRPYCARKSPRRDEADDMVQDAVLKAWMNSGYFARGANVKPWVFCIATRLMIDERRKLSLRPMLDRVELSAVNDVDANTALQYVEAAETGARLEAALSKLSRVDREAVELTKFGGLSLEEAAEVAGTTVGGMKSRVHRAFVALRAALEEGS